MKEMNRKEREKKKGQRQKKKTAMTPAPASRIARSRIADIRDRRVQIVRFLLEGSFHRKLGLREMGQAVNLSPWRLAHLFKAETGVSPQRYLTLVRLQRAKDQLADSFLSVQAIGAAVGIPNPSHFTKSFKAAYGMTPIEYRRLHLRIESRIGAKQATPAIASNALRLTSG
jgi:AraC-like DNA-binding protein